MKIRQSVFYSYSYTRDNVIGFKIVGFSFVVAMVPKIIKQEAESDVVSSELNSHVFNVTTHVQKNKRTPRARPARYTMQADKKSSSNSLQTKRSSSFRGVTRY